MEPSPASRLEQWIAGELKNLPELSAPASLLPRVLATLQARERQPWWQQPWWNWPMAAKVALSVLALGIAALMGSGGPVLGEHVASYANETVERLSPVAHLWETFGPISNSLALLWTALLEPWLLSGLAALTYLACLGVGTIFFRATFKRS